MVITRVRAPRAPQGADRNGEVGEWAILSWAAAGQRPQQPRHEHDREVRRSFHAATLAARREDPTRSGSGAGGTQPTDFAEDVAGLKALMERFIAQKSDPFPHHPLFGSMSSGESGRWGYRHIDHHLRQFGQ